MRVFLRQRSVWRNGLRTVLVAAMILSVPGCKREGSAESEDSAAPATPVPVRATGARLVTLHPSIDLVGTFVAIPEHMASLSSQVAGRIQKVMFVEGDAIHAGEELVRLDSRPAEAQLAKAEALVKEKRAILHRLKRGFLPQEIEMARQEMLKTQTTMEALRSKVNALDDLYKSNELSGVKFEEMKSSLQAAEADHDAAKAKLELLEAGTRPEEIAEAEAQLAIAQADLTAARLDVGFCRITSPIDGVISQLLARQGMAVDRSNLLATVVDLSSLFVQFRVPSVYLSKVRPGADAEVYVQSLSGRSFHGAVTRLSGQADPDTGDVDAFASIANEGGLLRPGLAGRVRVWLPAVDDALAIPTAAVADRAGTPVVTVVRNDKAYEIQVTLGSQTREQVEVARGLSVGDLVVTEGGYGLPAGCPVRVLSERPSSRTEDDAR